MNGEVISVNCSSTHSLIKPNLDSVRLLEGLGVEGDAHSGEDGETPLSRRPGPEPTQPAASTPDPL